MAVAEQKPDLVVAGVQSSSFPIISSTNTSDWFYCYFVDRLRCKISMEMLNYSYLNHCVIHWLYQ